MDNSKSKNYQQTMQSAETNEQILAMNDEMQTLKKNQTQNWIEKLIRHKAMECKRVFKKKEGAIKGAPIKFKVTLVAKRLTQQLGINYTKIFSPIVRQTSIQMFLAIVVQNNLELEQLDVKTAFLHRDLDETI